MSVCDHWCWAPTYCNICRRPFSPVGRSVALEAASGYCDPWEPCDRTQRDTATQRHLWSEHDPNRSYTDPKGWAAHVAACPQCKEDQ